MANRTVDYSTLDYEGFRTDLIEALKLKVPEYTDFSSSDVGIVLIELLAHGLDICSYYNDVVANESVLATATQRESVINLIRPYNYSIKNSTASKVYQVFEVDATKGEVTIPKLTQISTKSQRTEEIVVFETDQDLVIPQGATGLETDSKGDYIYKVSCTQGFSVKGEVVGTSTGVADQKFQLNYPKALDVTIFVDEGRGLEKWTKVDNFIDSDISSKHYTLYYDNSENCYVQFGNGMSGKIPTTFRNGIVAYYRVGGGSEGNVAPKTITECIDKYATIKATFNPDTPYVMAQDRETVESAKNNAPKCLRTLNRAVTLEDFKDLAELSDGILKANSIINQETKEVEVIVLPSYLAPLTPVLRGELEEMYDQKSLLGVTCKVKDYEESPINFDLDIKVYNNYNADNVKALVKKELESYFELGKRDFGEEIILGNIVSLLMYIDGVKSVGVNAPLEDVVVTPYAIPTLGTLTLNMIGGAIPPVRERVISND